MRTWLIPALGLALVTICQGASAQVGAPAQSGLSQAQAAIEREVEIAFAEHLLTAQSEAVHVTVEACILTIEFVDQLACSAAELSTDQVKSARTILDLRETELGPMTPLQMSGVFDGFLSGFRLGEAINIAAIEIGDHYPSFHVEKSGNTVIDQLRLSAWTAEVLNSRGVVSRTLKRTCEGELFTSNLLGFEEVFALKIEHRRRVFKSRQRVQIHFLRRGPLMASIRWAQTVTA